MSESKDRNEDYILDDLIEEAAGIGSLNIEERELQDFDYNQTARKAVNAGKPKQKFGKRSQRNRAAAAAADEMPPSQADQEKKETEFSVISPIGPGTIEKRSYSAIEQLRAERKAEKQRELDALRQKDETILNDSVETGALSQEEAEDAARTVNARLEQSAGTEIRPVSVEDFSAGSQEPALSEDKRLYEPNRIISTELKVDDFKRSDPQDDPALENTLTSLNLMGSAAAQALLAEQNLLQEEEEEEDDDEEIFDPEASLVDDYDYDLYRDTRHFLMSDYKKMEDYLEAQARQGFHYVQHEGSKFYFHKNEPSNDYYEAMFFTKEPVASQWEIWKEQGWEFVHRTGGKKKSDYGWVIFRHPEEPGQFRRVIDNNREKYRFFRKYANSCRSTLFVLFICMMTALVSAFLQWQFKGYLIGIFLCIVLFVISAYFCIVYARMLTKSRKQAQLLKARIRRQEHEAQASGSEEQELEEDWQTLEEKALDDEDDE